MEAPVRSAAALAEAFDAAFARPPASDRPDTEGFLALRLGDDPFAVRVSDIAALHADRRIVPMPSAEPTMLGVAAFRGRIAPVYDLAALLGYPAKGAPRWVLLAREDVALAAASFEGQLSVAAADVLPAAEHLSARPHVRGAVRHGGLIRPIADVASVIEEIRNRVSLARTTKGG